MKEITVQELKEKRDAGDEFVLIDVREQFEYLVSNLEGEHIALGDLETSLNQLERYKDTEVIMMCRSGGRSANACSFLERHGFTNVANLKGGITAWSKEIDPSIPVA
ncbi:MAG: rhodanese-like domain-containing protein [Balneolaceae bacterium]